MAGTHQDPWLLQDCDTLIGNGGRPHGLVLGLSTLPLAGSELLGFAVHWRLRLYVPGATLHTVRFEHLWRET